MSLWYFAVTCILLIVILTITTVIFLALRKNNRH